MKRYDDNGYRMLEHPDGEWVKYEDAQAEIAKLAKERDNYADLTERMKTALRQPGTKGSYVEWAAECRDAVDKLNDAQAEIERLIKIISSKDAALQDPATVHVNILRGTIALTKEQAMHIAGVDPTAYKAMQAEIERLSGLVKVAYVEGYCDGKGNHSRSNARLAYQDYEASYSKQHLSTETPMLYVDDIAADVPQINLRERR